MSSVRKITTPITTCDLCSWDDFTHTHTNIRALCVLALKQGYAGATTATTMRCSAHACTTNKQIQIRFKPHGARVVRLWRMTLHDGRKIARACAPQRDRDVVVSVTVSVSLARVY